MTNLERHNQVKAIVARFMGSLDNKDTQAELHDILVNHFSIMSKSDNSIDQDYFQVELEITRKESNK